MFIKVTIKYTSSRPVVRVNINHIVHYGESISSGDTILFTTVNNEKRPLILEETPEQIDQLIQQAMENTK